MGRIVGVRSFQRRTLRGANLSQVKVDLGGGRLQTADHFAAAGDDSQPLAGDLAIVVSKVGAGRLSVVGYADTASTPRAAPGDKRLYSRDSDGANVAEVWIKSDGSVIISNDSGAVTLAPSGEVDINGVTIDPAGKITCAELESTGKVAGLLVEAAGKDLTIHTHLAGTPPGATGPNI